MDSSSSKHANVSPTGAPSLLSMVKRQIIRNIDLLEDIGTLPYHLIRPILMRVESPAHLLRIEKLRPHIMDHDGEIWLRFIKRDIDNWQNRPHEPSNPRSWGKVYQKLLRQDEREKEKAMDVLRAQLEEHKQQVEDSKTKEDPKLRDPTARRPSTRAAPGFGPSRGNLPTLAVKTQVVAGKKLLSMNGKSTLALARKQAAAAAKQRQLATPAHKLSLVGRGPKAPPRDWLERMGPPAVQVEARQAPEAPSKPVPRRQNTTSDPKRPAPKPQSSSARASAAAIPPPATSRAAAKKPSGNSGFFTPMKKPELPKIELTPSPEAVPSRSPSPFHEVPKNMYKRKKVLDTDCLMPKKRR